jgi:hypothetical protein
MPATVARGAGGVGVAVHELEQHGRPHRFADRLRDRRDVGSAVNGRG